MSHRNSRSHPITAVRRAFAGAGNGNPGVPASAPRARRRVGSLVAGLGGVLALLVAVAAPAAATALTISGQTMEGDLQLPPGSSVGAGYDVNGRAGTTLTVSSGVVTLHFACAQNGPAVGTLSLAFPSYTVQLGSSGWYPSGDQQSAAVWQVPDQSVASATAACHGGSVWVNSHTGGASYAGDLTSSPAGAKVSVRFHYRETNPHSTSGSWSATDSVTTSSPLPPVPTCPAGTTLQSNGGCASPPVPTCPAGTTLQSNGGCVSPPVPTCPAGTTVQSNGGCVSPPVPTCPAGTTVQPNGGCTSPSTASTCPGGGAMTDGQCPTTSVLGEHLSQTPVGGVDTGAGGTSRDGNHRLAVGAGLGLAALAGSMTIRRRWVFNRAKPASK